MKVSFAKVRTCAVVAVVALVAACAASAASMTTPWGEKVTGENCWRGYPRPQMVRERWTNLNGEWDYAVTSVTNTPGRPEKWDGKILVPFPIESALSGVGRLLKPDEFLWYTRKIECDPKPGERILLHFGGVDFRTMVFIGHDEVTDVPHEGGQNPFTVDITDYVKKGENELTVCVWDPTEDFVNSRGKQSFAPKGCFYTRVSGIWQTVWMETVPEKYIKSYKVVTDIDKGEVTLSFQGTGNGERGTVEIETSASPRLCVKKPFVPNEPVTVKLPEPVALWSPENPRLYNFTAKYGRDVVKGYFGMRKIEKRKDAKGVLRFFLNNRPYFMIGTLDQGWWPDGLLTPPSEEAMEYDVKVLKDCGFNMLRKHIKVEPQQYYAMCDRLGILVIQDLPSGTGSWRDPMKAETVKRYGLQRQEMKEMMDDLQPFACIVMWNPYNEGWSQPGEFLTHSMLDFTKRYDKTRLVNGPSGCWDWEGGHLLPEGWNWEKRVLTQHKPDGVCEAADTVDMHLYRGPTMFAVNDRRISFLGEFGGLGHPVDGHLWKVNPGGRGNWGYGGIEDTKTREGLEKAYLGLMDELGHLAEKGLGGAVYTQTTDVEIEVNGILTYDRKVLKFNPEVLRKAHAEVVRRAIE
ncbi:MAG: beta-galactosidase [Kiritimatiellae bacterium]|nr:beta-galactosidase [Kiritimatiellia bacterium]